MTQAFQQGIRYVLLYGNTNKILKCNDRISILIIQKSRQNRPKTCQRIKSVSFGIAM